MNKHNRRIGDLTNYASIILTVLSIGVLVVFIGTLNAWGLI